MNIRDGIILRDVLGQAVLFDNSGKLREVIKLNNTAVFIWNGIEKGDTPKSIAKNMALEFAIDEDAAFSDVSQMIEDFYAKGLLI